jgi:hypothetical protein
MNRYLSLMAFIGALIMGLIGSNALAGNDKLYSISIVVEEGFVIPSFTLQYEQEAEVTFEITEGNARFGNVQAVTKPASAGTISIPQIIPGPVYDESFIKITVNGERIFEDVRVATLPKDGITQLITGIGADNPAIIEASSHYAIVNETVLKSSEEQSEKKNLRRHCYFRTPRGPGEVDWQFSDPAGNGKFSVKPESSSNLVWAKGWTTQDVDAIYSAYWGCGTALKIPDSCTLTVYSNSEEGCCNYAMTLLGHVIRWVNTYNISTFPNCPL